MSEENAARNVEERLLRDSRLREAIPQTHECDPISVGRPGSHLIDRCIVG